MHFSKSHNAEMLFVQVIVAAVVVSRSDNVPTEYSTSTTTTTSPAVRTVATSATPIVNENIFGCRWPDDIVSRFTFCLKKHNVKLGSGSAADLEAESEKIVDYGLLDWNILDQALQSCTADSPEKCLTKINNRQVKKFVGRWLNESDRYEPFETCLRENTEAMVRLCDTDSQISRVVSGSSGLQLNLVNVLVNVGQRQSQGRQRVMTDRGEILKPLSDQCLDSVAALVHFTAVLYLKTEHFKDNTVLCWDVAKSRCDKGCAALTMGLNCLESNCPLLKPHLSNFAIWQWYFSDVSSARAVCGIESKQASKDCQILLDTKQSNTSGTATLFDQSKWRHRLRKLKVGLEKKFDLSIETLLAVFVSVFFAFLVSVLVLCLWWHGLCCAETDGRRVRRYSPLSEGDRYDDRTALTRTIKDDEDDDFTVGSI